LSASLIGGGLFVFFRYLKPETTAPAIIYEARDDLDNRRVTTDQRDDHKVAADKPRYMSIPALGVERARVIEIGIKPNSDNQLDDPTSIHDVGWYQQSALPGQPTEYLPAGLYDGHNTGVSERGVFWNLASLKNGDEIAIERGDGEVLTYQVVEVEVPKLSDIDMSKMLQTAVSGREGLNIITCAGSWNNYLGTFDHRATVRAVRD
jgi:LPXTG-site transpeptidase (sortase) family protein